jgi:lipooligosaccharide transport system permease protein
MAEVTPSSAPRNVVDGALRLVDYWAIGYRRTWKGSAISSFVNPLLYVLAMGVLLGDYVSAGPGQLDGAPSYLAFIAPGLLAAQSMQTVFGETTYPVMGMIKWQKTYFGMTASPLSVREVILGQLGFVMFRVGLTCGVFTLVMVPFGVYATAWGAVLAYLVQFLVGLAFATPLFAFSAGLKNEAPFALVFRLGMIPLFLFSGAFFPISNLDPWMETLARITPLWHGVDLTRMLTLDEIDVRLALVHVTYLTVLAAVGWVLAVRRLGRRLSV